MQHACSVKPTDGEICWLSAGRSRIVDPFCGQAVASWPGFAHLTSSGQYSGGGLGLVLELQPPKLCPEAAGSSSSVSKRAASRVPNKLLCLEHRDLSVCRADASILSQSLLPGTHHDGRPDLSGHLRARFGTRENHLSERLGRFKQLFSSLCGLPLAASERRSMCQCAGLFCFHLLSYIHVGVSNRCDHSPVEWR